MKKKLFAALSIVVLGGLIGYSVAFLLTKYQSPSKMTVPILELSALENGDDPSHLAPDYQKYNQRELRLEKTKEGLFNFTFTSPLPYVASIGLHNLDLTLLVPTRPKSIRGDRTLEIITFVEREWNRQQVSFSRQDPHLTINGGDGTETSRISSVELARNCLNAGRFELLIYTGFGSERELFYHGWFQFPLGHYKELFEKSNQLSYWRFWHRLEHWISPEGKILDQNQLRTVVATHAIPFDNQKEGVVIAKGEQLRKRRCFCGKDTRLWEDFCSHHESVEFATFILPGIYKASKRWKNEFQRIEKLNKVHLRQVRSSLTSELLSEIELVYGGEEATHLIVGGFSLETLPRLTLDEYTSGFSMPLGISIPPVLQSYQQLEQSPPAESPYYAFLLNDKQEWLNHHKIAIDGTILFRDANDPDLLHFLLLSYERHSLVAHYKISLNPLANAQTIPYNEVNQLCEDSMKKQVYIVVANSSVAKIYHAENVNTLNEVQLFEHPQSSMQTQDLISDRGGRANERMGLTPHTIEQKVSEKVKESVNFAQEIGRFLQKKVNERECDAIYIFANPTFLGHLRQNVSHEVKEHIVQEVDKDLTQSEPRNIREYLPPVL